MERFFGLATLHFMTAWVALGLIAARHAGVRRGAGDATGRDATERGVQV